MFNGNAANNNDNSYPDLNINPVLYPIIGTVAGAGGLGVLAALAYCFRRQIRDAYNRCFHSATPVREVGLAGAPLLAANSDAAEQGSQTPQAQ